MKQFASDGGFEAGFEVKGDWKIKLLMDKEDRDRKRALRSIMHEWKKPEIGTIIHPEFLYDCSERRVIKFVPIGVEKIGDRFCVVLQPSWEFKKVPYIARQYWGRGLKAFLDEKAEKHIQLKDGDYVLPENLLLRVTKHNYASVEVTSHGTFKQKNRG